MANHGANPGSLLPCTKLQAPAESSQEELAAGAEPGSPECCSCAGEGQQGKGSRNKRKYRSECASAAALHQEGAPGAGIEGALHEAESSTSSSEFCNDVDAKPAVPPPSPSTDVSTPAAAGAASSAAKGHPFPDDVRMIPRWLCQNISIPFLRPGGRVSEEDVQRPDEANLRLGCTQGPPSVAGCSELTRELEQKSEDSKKLESVGENVSSKIAPAGELLGTSSKSKAVVSDHDLRATCGWDKSTEAKLEELLLEKLGTVCGEAVVKIVALGYDLKDAKDAVAKHGSCYGEKDALSNVVSNVLNPANRVESSSSPVDVQRSALAKLVSALQAKRRPQLSRGDAMWCLLMCDLDINKACDVELDPLHNARDPHGSSTVGKDICKAAGARAVPNAAQQHSQSQNTAVSSSTATGATAGTAKVKHKQLNGTSGTGKSSAQASKDEIAKSLPSLRNLERSDSGPAVVKACMEAILGAGVSIPSQDMNLGSVTQSGMAGLQAAVEAVAAQAVGHGIESGHLTGPVARQMAGQLASKVLGKSTGQTSREVDEDNQKQRQSVAPDVSNCKNPNPSLMQQIFSSTGGRPKQQVDGSHVGQLPEEHSAVLGRPSDDASVSSTPPSHTALGSTVTANDAPGVVDADGAHLKDAATDTRLPVSLERSSSSVSSGERKGMKQPHGASLDGGQNGVLDGDLQEGACLNEPSIREGVESVAGVVARFDRLNATHSAVLEQCVLLEKRVVELEAQSEEKRDKRQQQVEQRIQELEQLLEERNEWAQQKVMQAARRLLKDSAELKALRAERDEAARIKKERAALEDTLRKASGQVDRANAAVRRLESENAEMRAEMQAANLRANEAALKLAEGAKREGKTLKKIQAWERQKVKLQEECVEERRKVQLSKQESAQAKERQLQAEVHWRQEEKAKEEALARAEVEKRAKEQVEAAAKRREEGLRRKAEADSLRYREDIERLEREIAQLRWAAGASLFSAAPVLETDSGVVHTLQDTVSSRLQEKPELNEGNSVRRERECVMCMSEEGSVVFLPCAHQVVCRMCNSLHEQRGMRDCPSCRTPIQQRIRVFGAS